MFQIFRSLLTSKEVSNQYLFNFFLNGTHKSYWIFQVSHFKAASDVLEEPKDIWSSPFKIAPTTIIPMILESLTHQDSVHTLLIRKAPVWIGIQISIIVFQTASIFVLPNPDDSMQDISRHQANIHPPCESCIHPSSGVVPFTPLYTYFRWMRTREWKTSHISLFSS